MKCSKLFFVFLLLIGHALFAQNDSVYLWPALIPNQTKPKGQPITTTIDDGSTRVTEVTNPFFAVFEPKKENKNNKAIIVCPGGGYVRLAVHKEGYTVANWLTGLGYTVFVLQYRVPDNRDGALFDLQRALKLIRHDSKKYGIDPTKIGAIGFSAGAHVVARRAWQIPHTLIQYRMQLIMKMDDLTVWLLFIQAILMRVQIKL